MNKKPIIRFKNYNEDWEQRKLGDVCSITTGKLDANAMVESGQYDFYTSGIKKFRIDTFAFEGPAITIAGNGATVGYMHLANGRFNAYQRTYVLNNFSVAREFLFAEIGRKLPKKINQEARTGNIPYIVMDMLTDLNIRLPNIEEQQKIGSFFKQLDDTITLQQRKIEALEKTKKSFLQKMFPKKDETKPEIRFAGFTDDWEQRKLGEIIQVNSGKDYKHLNEGEIPVYGTGGYMLSVDEALSYKDAIGLGRKGTINKPYLLKAPFWTVDTLFYSVPINNNDLSFIDTLFQNINWKKYDESTGVPSLSKNSIIKIEKKVPSIEEQEKIGLFFKKISETIALHQRQLEALEKMKKSFLQKMFI